MPITALHQAIRHRVLADVAQRAPLAPALGPRDTTRLLRRDRNGDGRLGLDEFSPSRAGKHSQLDLDHNGNVDLQELLEFARRQAARTTPPTREPSPLPPARPNPVVAPARPVTPAIPPASSAPAAPTPAAPAPMPAPPQGERPATAPAGEAPYINQYRPAGAEQGYWNGAANCGPASLAMIARAVGYRSDLSDAALINHLGAIGGTSGAGTPVANLTPMAEAMGLSAETRGPGADVAWISEQLRAGKFVVANGDYFEMAPHRDPSRDGGHYVLVTGITPDGRFQVHDPADAAVSTLSGSELERFIASNPNGGYQVAVG